jgi:nondiscriminating glutamyl-tRNA synthetase
MFRTRQAPSPTGYLHIGTARTVLFTKLFAMINNGIWYLRLEDTDRNRLQSEAVKTLLGALGQIGLRADEGISLEAESGNKSQSDDFYGIYQQGEFGPYIQSQRLSIYHEHAQKLIDQNLAYWSYLTPEDKQELQEIKQITKHPINYSKVCSEKFSSEDLKKSVLEALQDERKPVLMYRLQRDQKIVCKDELLGESEFDLKLEEDFGILKSDGYPTYHLAHLVDDHLMQTSMVLRAQEWFPSFPRHQTMFLDYWKTMPQYCHVPFILGENGNKKMSKRDGNVNTQDYLDKGYLPEALINYLAFLGWNPGTEKELYL